MKDVLKIALGIILGAIGLAICAICAFFAFGAGGVALFSSLPTATPYSQVSLFPSQTAPSLIPTASATPGVSQLGETWSADGLAVSVLESELSGCFTSKYSSDICTADGATYLWVHLQRDNLRGSTELPIYSCFWITLLYAGQELHPDSYGEHPIRPNWADGACNELYAGSHDEGWVYFEAPIGIDLSMTRLRVETYQGPTFEREWILIITD